MRGRGMTYDTGFVRTGRISRTDYDPQVVRRELAVIRDDLHCNAVHIIGGDPDRLELAARYAAELGLEVWFSPYPLEMTEDEIRRLFEECADLAERLRLSGAEIVFVAGVELSIMNRGFLPGESPMERVDFLLSTPERLAERLADLGGRLDAFFAEAIPAVRARFHGKVTYACVPLERIDWSRFDFLSIELIRSAEVADRFRDGVRTLVAQGKPVAVTGFGTATWRGSGAVAPRSMEIVETDVHGAPIRIDGEYFRDEAGQAAYIEELLSIFDSEGVDSTFVFLFALDNYPHRPHGDPRDDLDLASFGIVKVLDGFGDSYPDMHWEPKKAFSAVADFYRS